MKIGKLALETVERKVEEVHEHLLQLLGIGAKEMHAALAFPQMAGMVAAALVPLLAEPFERHALAEAIQKEGVAEVQAKVRAMYDALVKEAGSGESEAA